MKIKLMMVDEFHGGEMGVPFDLEDPEASDAIIAAKGFSGLPATRAQKEKADDVLEKANSTRRWLVCNCQELHALREGIKPFPSPVMHSRLRKRGETASPPDIGDLEIYRSEVESAEVVIDAGALKSYRHRTTLARNASSGFHASICPLHRDRTTRELDGYDDPADPMDNRTKTRLDHLGFLSHFSTGESESGEAAPTYRRGVRKRIEQSHRLAAVLMLAFEKAKLDVWRDGPARTLKTDLDALMHGLCSLPIDADRNHMADQWSVTSVNNLSDLIQLIGTADPTEWPGKDRPQGFIFEVAMDVGVNQANGQTNIATLNGTLVVDGSVHRPGYTTQGPFLAVGVVTAASDGVIPSVVQAYLHPLADARSLFLVDSGLEREVFRVLKSELFKQSNNGQKFHYRITKPLIDWTTTQGLCRPDFIVDVGARRRIVEVMGMKTSVYYEGKDVTHPRMKELATRIPWQAAIEDALVLVDDARPIASLVEEWVIGQGISPMPMDPLDMC